STTPANIARTSRFARRRISSIDPAPSTLSSGRRPAPAPGRQQSARPHLPPAAQHPHTAVHVVDGPTQPVGGLVSVGAVIQQVQQPLVLPRGPGIPAGLAAGGHHRPRRVGGPPGTDLAPLLR